MPVEGQWRRVNAPLPARDRRALAIAACAAVLASAGATAAYLSRSTSPHGRCVVVTVASTMGGAVHKTCRPAARRK
jgi:hypothetical protein